VVVIQLFYTHLARPCYIHSNPDLSLHSTLSNFTLERQTINVSL
jgi:hypothetical protein